jgi:bud emergence protein 1
LNLKNPAQPYPEKLLAPISASIPRYCFENDKYWYIIECVLEDGSHWELSRFYQNFYDFQINLLQAFPEEAAPSNGSPRILPFMPGPVTYVTDAISNGRRESLDLYVKALLQLPHYISRCDLVKRLFQPVEGDFELDPKAMAEDYRLSNLSQQSGSNSQSLSQQSSHDQMGHNGNSFAQQQQRPNHQRNQSSQQYSNGGNSMYGAPPQGVQRQQSNLTQMSTNSSSTPPLQGPGGAANPSGALKIKVFFEDDLIAIRVPDNITFLALKDKLKERLKVREEIMIQYKDEPSGGYAELLNDRDLDLALQRNAKLTLYVGYA